MAAYVVPTPASKPANLPTTEVRAPAEGRPGARPGRGVTDRSCTCFRRSTAARLHDFGIGHSGAPGRTRTGRGELRRLVRVLRASGAGGAPGEIRTRWDGLRRPASIRFDLRCVTVPGAGVEPAGSALRGRRSPTGASRAGGRSARERLGQVESKPGFAPGWSWVAATCLATRPLRRDDGPRGRSRTDLLLHIRQAPGSSASRGHGAPGRIRTDPLLLERQGTSPEVDGCAGGPRGPGLAGRPGLEPGPLR